MNKNLLSVLTNFYLMNLASKRANFKNGSKCNIHTGNGELMFFFSNGEDRIQSQVLAIKSQDPYRVI